MIIKYEDKLLTIDNRAQYLLVLENEAFMVVTVDNESLAKRLAEEKRGKFVKIESNMKVETL